MKTSSTIPYHLPTSNGRGTLFFGFSNLRVGKTCHGWEGHSSWKFCKPQQYESQFGDTFQVATSPVMGGDVPVTCIHYDFPGEQEQPHTQPLNLGGIFKQVVGN